MNQESKFSLRPARTEDSEFIYRLVCETMKQYVIATWGVWDEKRVRDESAQAASSPDAHVVFVGHNPAGLMTVEHHSDHIQVEQLYLLPQFQRKGLGSLLMRNVLAEAVTRGHPVRLQVLQVNPARSFYERLGFVVRSHTQERVSMEFRAVPSENGSILK